MIHLLRRTWRSKTFRWIANIVLCAVFVGLVASLALPAIYEICGPNEYTHAKECTQYHLPQFIFLWTVGVGDTHNGLITAIATVLLTWLTVRLARLEQESGETQRAELRAYMSANTRGITVAQDGETITIYVQLTNAGQTPAFNVVVPCGISVLPPDRRFQVASIRITAADIDELPITTLPKDGKCVVHATKKIPYTDAIKYLSTANNIYIFGLITYQDVFGNSQWTEFCQYLEWKRFQRFLAAALDAGPDEKIDISFKVASFGQDSSLNPRHAEKMRHFRQGIDS